MKQTPIKQFAMLVRPSLRLIEDGVNRLGHRPVDNAPDSPIPADWTDQQTLDQLRYRIEGIRTLVQTTPTP